MNKIKLAIISFAALVGVVAMVPAYDVSADAKGQIQGGVTDVGGKEGGNATPLADRIKVVVNMLLFAIGAAAVIMIIIGGIRYVTSNGESSGISGAKNTILYAVVGLIVAILAYAIVNFVIDQF